MIHPRIDELLDEVDSRYALVIVAAKRARQINNYHHQLGEGTFDEFPPLVESRSKNYLTMSLEEIAEGKIKYTYTASSASRQAAGCGTMAHGPRPPRSDRWHRRLQGVRADPPARQGRARGDAGPDGRRRRRFVTARTFEALARREQPRELYPHLVEADLLVIAPLSANTLAKLAHGLADNVLTQLALAFRGPILVAPAMNVRMWEHPATQANVALLRERGVELIGPEAGRARRGRDRPRAG